MFMIVPILRIMVLEDGYSSSNTKPWGPNLRMHISPATNILLKPNFCPKANDKTCFKPNCCCPVLLPTPTCSTEQPKEYNFEYQKPSKTQHLECISMVKPC